MEYVKKGVVILSVALNLVFAWAYLQGTVYQAGFTAGQQTIINELNMMVENGQLSVNQGVQTNNVTNEQQSEDTTTN